ncbi:MAG: hypothetical protein EOO40_13120 [Deltaproteobacteria bacterium]|nr:MAG: hypothetical protein EOO40_13120 [Deltaproteobacteria bacterium]
MAVEAIVNGAYSDPGGTGIVYTPVNTLSCCSTSIASSTITGGMQAASFQLSANTSATFNMPPTALMLQPGDTCSVAVIANRSAAAAVEVDLSVSWSETP